MSQAEEDRLLAWEQFEELNRKFYTAKSQPHDYVEARLRALLLATSGSNLIAQAAAGGFQIGDLKVAFGDDSEDPKEVERERREFLVSESSVLLHHAGETLMRLFLAHVGLPKCPRLEAARLRQFWRFKKRLEEFARSLQDGETQASVMEVFTGAARRDQLGGAIPADKWTEHRDGLVALLGTVTGILLSDGALYNAAKHGLAIMPTEAGVRFDFGAGAPDIDLSADGSALTYLQAVDTPNGKRWQETINWVSPESNLSLTFLVSQQMKTLLRVARARYVRPGDGYQVLPITTEMVQTVMDAGWPKKPYLIKSMGEPLMYYAESDALGDGELDSPTA